MIRRRFRQSGGGLVDTERRDERRERGIVEQSGTALGHRASPRRWRRRRRRQQRRWPSACVCEREQLDNRLRIDSAQATATGVQSSGAGGGGVESEWDDGEGEGEGEEGGQGLFKISIK
jgi:hypothetical protein